MERYRHTQVGYVTAFTLGAALIGALLYIIYGGYSVALIVATALIFLLLVIFSTLTVSVDDRHVTLSFGGIFKKRFLLEKIGRVEPVRNHWWYGWGVHLTPHGWLYNVSGFEAVELYMEDDRHYRIGSDDAENLARVIKERLKDKSHN